MPLSDRAIMTVVQSTSTSRMARTRQSAERAAQRTYATGPFQAMSMTRLKSASVCSSYDANRTGTIGAPASSKYARIPSQIVAALGPAATAPTRTALVVITPSSVCPPRPPRSRPCRHGEHATTALPAPRAPDRAQPRHRHGRLPSCPRSAYFRPGGRPGQALASACPRLRGPARHQPRRQTHPMPRLLALVTAQPAEGEPALRLAVWTRHAMSDCDDDVGARLGQHLGDTLTDPAPGPGDERHRLAQIVFRNRHVTPPRETPYGNTGRIEAGLAFVECRTPPHRGRPAIARSLAVSRGAVTPSGVLARRSGIVRS